MNLPFTKDQFFAIFAEYNRAVWPAQPLLFLTASLMVAALFRRGLRNGRIIPGGLSILWLWMAVVYHFMFFSWINPAAWLFGGLFLLAAVGFAWYGIVRNELHFAMNPGWRAWLGGTLILYALFIYPFIGYATGHRYPAFPTFGLPCPTTIFTLGILLFARDPAPRAVFIVPLVWCVVGSIAAFQLGVIQDLGLVAAGLAVLPMLMSCVPINSFRLVNKCLRWARNASRRG